MESRGTLSLVLCLLLCVPAAFAQDQPEPDPKKRAKAVRDFARNADASAIPKLAEYLKDPDKGVRLEAVKGIVSIGGVPSLNPLAEATRDNDAEIQAWATDGIVNFYMPGYVKQGFTASLKRTGDVIVGKFVPAPEVAVDHYVAGQVRPELAKALGRVATGSASMAVRANAARALGILRSRQGVPDLLEAARSKDTTVMLESLLALQKIGDTKAGEGVVFLLRDLDPKVQIAAIETVGILQTRAALKPLMEIFSRSDSKEVRRAALSAVAMVPDKASHALLTEYLVNKDDDLRTAAAEGLGRLRDPADKAKLAKGFEDERKMKPRLALAFALVEAGNLELSEFSPLQYLVNTLNSSSYRNVAEAYLIELCREQAARQALYPGMAGRTREEKIGLARILAQSGQKDSLPVLEKLGADPDTTVGVEAARSLRTLRTRVE